MLVELLAAQVRRLSGHLVEALYMPVEQRMRRRLAELAEMYGDARPIEIRLRQDDLASMVGTTRPTANRILRQLEDDGVVALRRGTVHVLDDARAVRAGVRVSPSGLALTGGDLGAAGAYIARDRRRRSARAASCPIASRARRCSPTSPASRR